MNKKVLIYPGCLVFFRFPEYESAAHKVIAHLGYTPLSPEKAVCCGSIVEAHNEEWHRYAVYTLALAERLGAQVVTLCGGCGNAFARTLLALDQDKALQKSTRKWLAGKSLSLEKPVVVRHIIRFLHDHSDQIRAKIVRQIPLRVAPVYPCQAFRPREIMRFDNPFSPTSIDELLQLGGMQPVHYKDMYSCCGSSLYLERQEMALSMGANRIENMEAAEADCFVTGCGNCQLLLQKMQSYYRKGRPFPGMFVPQALGLALGFTAEEMHITNVLRKKALL